MKNVGITKACSEDWNKMTTTEKGAFCQKCATNVHDFTNKSKEEVKEILIGLLGQPVCGRMSLLQEQELNAEFEAWQYNSRRTIQSAMLFSLIVVFGLSLFSCSNEKEKKSIVQLQNIALQIIDLNDQKVTKDEINQEVKHEPRKIINEEIITPIANDEISEEVILDSYFDAVTVVTEQAERSMDHYTLGIMIMVPSYTDYLFDSSSKIETEYDEFGNPLPNEYSSKVFPNPASTSSNLEINIPLKEAVEISLFDLSGKKLQSIYSGDLERGTFRYPINLIDLPSGMYLVVISSEKYKESVRLSKL